MRITELLKKESIELGVKVSDTKLARKNFDFIVLNSLRDAGAGFRGDTNKVTFIDRTGREPLPLMPKSEVAGRIVDKIESLLK